MFIDSLNPLDGAARAAGRALGSSGSCDTRLAIQPGRTDSIGSLVKSVKAL